GWRWHGPERVVEGRSWGGCLETLALLAIADRIGPVEEFTGGVLFVETSEELPSPGEVYRILRSLGERGLLARFPAAMVGRAKTGSLDRHTTPEEREDFRRGQRESVLRAFGEYAPEAVLVLDVDFGHTDPQQVIPYGGTVRVDGQARTITVTY